MMYTPSKRDRTWGVDTIFHVPHQNTGPWCSWEHSVSTNSIITLRVPVSVSGRSS